MGLQDTMKALADPTRREILRMLRAKKMSAGEIEACFDTSFAAISRHLSVLKDADLVKDTRDGKYIFYELNASVLEEIICWMQELRGEDHAEKK
ncbi:MAG: autorepressor SdpR family transcription factor [Lachnospiraceae bacterium]|nr:autorepressor SdpR family transcription factor [Lachnospiraceae bacterium]